MELWHGSDKIVESPCYGVGKPYNDYGQGFYCTEHKDLACEWAVSHGRDGFANRYELAPEGLICLNLSDSKYTILNWIALLIDNRSFRLDSPVARRGAAYLKEAFLLDIEGFDVIKGYRADDSYFSFARAFLSNTITVEQLARAMKLGKLGEQVVIKSRRAFEAIEYLGFEAAPIDTYGLRREARDRKAREEYRKILAEEDDTFEGLRIVDIIREGVTNDDLRIR